MIDKTASGVASALEDVGDGTSVLVSGFGEVGSPTALLEALLDTGARDLTIVANNAGVGEHGIAALFRANRVSKIVCSFPRSQGSVWFERRYAEGRVELEVVPQGTLAERIRAAGAGLGGFFTPTSAGTPLAHGKETRVLNDRTQVFEHALGGELALLHAHRGDRWGNLTYRATARNFAPVMATAAKRTVVEVDHLVELGALCPESVVTPGVYVDSLVQLSTDRGAPVGTR